MAPSYMSRASLFPLFPVFWVWIVIESIVLRWHYVVDDIAGFFLAVFIICLVRVLFSKTSRIHDGAAGQTTLGSNE